MTSRADLIAFLDSLGVDHRTVEHPAVFHVGEGEAIKAALPGAHTKNLFLKDAKGQAWLVCAEQDTRIDLKRLAGAIGAGRLSFGSPALMGERLGVAPGAVTIFALINDVERRVRLVLDVVLAKAEQVNFHPLVNTATTGVSRTGLRHFLEAVGARPMIVDFTAIGEAAGCGETLRAAATPTM